jgi:hypothetical protein
MIIKPTIGRVVWFYPSEHKEGDQPCSAQIAYVHSDTCINIGYFDHNGNAKQATSVTLFHGEGERPKSYFCEWMPYQVGQAKKHEPTAEAKS